MTKLFASDLDGTLLNILHKTDFIILKGIRRILKSGNYFAIATGRNMRFEHIKYDFKDIPIYCIAMNGAMIIKGNEIIYEKPMDKTIIKELLSNFKDINFEFITRNHVYTKCKKEDFDDNSSKMSFFIRIAYKRFKKLYANDYIYDANDDDILKEDILKVNCNIDDKDIALRFNNYLKDKEDVITNAPFNDITYEITMNGVNKGTAIKHLAKLLNINEDDIYVYGDGKNDITMLEMFNNSYAPNNACLEAKKAARHIIGNNNHYSVIKHMNNIINNKHNKS